MKNYCGIVYDSLFRISEIRVNEFAVATDQSQLSQIRRRITVARSTSSLLQIKEEDENDYILTRRYASLLFRL